MSEQLIELNEIGSNETKYSVLRWYSYSRLLSKGMVKWV